VVCVREKRKEEAEEDGKEEEEEARLAKLPRPGNDRVLGIRRVVVLMALGTRRRGDGRGERVHRRRRARRGGRRVV
jgi:hypothetical protein